MNSKRFFDHEHYFFQIVSYLVFPTCISDLGGVCSLWNKRITPQVGKVVAKEVKTLPLFLVSKASFSVTPGRNSVTDDKISQFFLYFTRINELSIICPISITMELVQEQENKHDPPQLFLQHKLTKMQSWYNRVWNIVHQWINSRRSSQQNLTLNFSGTEAFKFTNFGVDEANYVDFKFPAELSFQITTLRVLEPNVEINSSISVNWLKYLKHVELKFSSCNLKRLNFLLQYVLFCTNIECFKISLDSLYKGVYLIEEFVCAANYCRSVPLNLMEVKIETVSRRVIPADNVFENLLFDSSFTFEMYEASSVWLKTFAFTPHTFISDNKNVKRSLKHQEYVQNLLANNPFLSLVKRM
jgi:hypothetical protein